MGQITKPGMNRLAALGCRQATHQRQRCSGGVLKVKCIVDGFGGKFWGIRGNSQ